MNAPKCCQLQKSERYEAPELPCTLEHAPGGRIVQENKEERDNDNENEGVAVKRRECL